MTKALQIVAAAFLVTAVAIKAAPALAEPAAPINVTFVQTSDLDLSTAAGQRALDVRLAQAAREVCGTASDVDLEGKNDVRKCRVEVLAKAEAKRGQLLAAAAHGAVIEIAAR